MVKMTAHCCQRSPCVMSHCSLGGLSKAAMRLFNVAGMTESSNAHSLLV